MTMKKILSMLLSVLMLLSLAACGGAEVESAGVGDAAGETAGGEAAVAEEPMVHLITANAESLSPLDATESESVLMSFTQGTLYKLFPTADGEGAELLPDLAAGEPVEVGGDGLVWNIAISPDAKWHTGEAITAETFEFSMKAALAPKLPAAQAELLVHNGITVKNARQYADGELTDWSKVGIKAVDGNILQITAERPCRAEDVMQHFSGYWTAPVHEETYTSGLSADGSSTTYGTSRLLTIYSGPYMVTGRVSGFYLRLNRNPYYPHPEKYSFNRVQLDVQDNNSAAVGRVEKGEADYIWLDSVRAGQLAGDPRMTALPSRYIRTIDFCDVNTEQPILANGNFKKAVYYAVDREAVAALTGARPASYAVAHASRLGAAGAVFRDLPEAQEYLPANNGFDPDAAVAYLDKALKEEGLSSVSVKLLYAAGGVDRIIAEYLQEQFEAVFGGKLQLVPDPVPESLYLSTVGEWRSDPNAYEMALARVGTVSGDSNPAEVFGVYTSKAAMRNGSCPRSSRTIDALYERSLLPENRDAQTLAELAMEMEKAFIEETVAVPIVEDVTYVLCAERIELPLKTANTALGCGICYGRFAQ